MLCRAMPGCMAALEAEWYLQGLELGGTGTSMDQGDTLAHHGPVTGRGAVQHDHHGPVTSGRKAPAAAAAQEASGDAAAQKQQQPIAAAS